MKSLRDGENDRGASQCALTSDNVRVIESKRDEMKRAIAHMDKQEIHTKM
jgi:hypothetical protein